MRVKSICYTSGEKIRRISRPEARHVKIELLQVDPILGHNVRNEPLAIRMVDKGRLHLGKDPGDLLCSQIRVDVARITLE